MDPPGAPPPPLDTPEGRIFQSPTHFYPGLGLQVQDPDPHVDRSSATTGPGKKPEEDNKVPVGAQVGAPPRARPPVIRKALSLWDRSLQDQDNISEGDRDDLRREDDEMVPPNPASPQNRY